MSMREAIDDFVANIRVVILIRIWKINYIRHRWCRASAVEWAYFGGFPFRRVDTACDYCGNCKNKESEG